MINAVIPIWKPVDWTSFDVVKKIRGQIKPAKVGHAGTLDPFAEGVLMLCAGTYTKKVESYMDKEKEYIAVITLGSETDTLDSTGKVIKISPVTRLSKKVIEDSFKNFIGGYLQIPPMYSALKKNGKPLYIYARKGVEISREKRRVNIIDISLLDYSPKSITIKVNCGRGTYIRSLAKDIAEALDTTGYVQTLQRTRIGEFNRTNCFTPDKFSSWLSARI
ncbi:MAG: tRNA pseudouridine(55) synthase TruB [Candidatus Marinimicrobia bacterium]|jgi:tRNA pseudouridine55 synthase|nr:tRNA pseudouridine(55) synthase TruB [Candidatus Neomarinimicrobiota bacterium]